METARPRGRTSSRIDLSDPDFWRGTLESRYVAFDALRRDLPVAWQAAPLAWASDKFPPPRGYWAVTRHSDVCATSRNTRDFISGAGVMFFDNLPRETQYLFEGFVGLDAPRHTQLRRLVAKAFTPAMLSQIEGSVRRQAIQAIRDVADRGSCDFYHELAAPLPVAVICDMMGVRPSDRSELRRLMHVVNGFGFEGITFDNSVAAAREITQYGLELARARRTRPRRDLTTALVGAEIDGQRLDDEDIGATFFVIFSGGMDTVSTTAAHAMLALTQFPLERRRWQADFEAIADTAIEELLRWATPVLQFRRTATREVEIAGQAVAAGENVVLWYLSANRDEAVFHDPYRLDLSRQPNPHVAFGGGGPHFCLGSYLARIELKIFFRELFRLLPDIVIRGAAVSLPSPFVNTFKSLPCTFTPRVVS